MATLGIMSTQGLICQHKSTVRKSSKAKKILNKRFHVNLLDCFQLSLRTTGNNYNNCVYFRINGKKQTYINQIDKIFQVINILNVIYLPRQLQLRDKRSVPSTRNCSALTIVYSSCEAFRGRTIKPHKPYGRATVFYILCLVQYICKPQPSNMGSINLDFRGLFFIKFFSQKSIIIYSSCESASFAEVLQRIRYSENNEMYAAICARLIRRSLGRLMIRKFCEITPLKEPLVDSL